MLASGHGHAQFERVDRQSSNSRIAIEQFRPVESKIEPNAAKSHSSVTNSYSAVVDPCT